MTEVTASGVAKALRDRADRVRVDEVSRARRAPGLYCWWSLSPAVFGIPGTRHRGAYLYYVGKAEKSLRSRLRTHATGTTRSSTERLTLAALAFEVFGWTPGVSSRDPRRRARLVDEVDELALTEWIADNFSVSWVLHDEPALVESEVIRLLEPPLNLDHNGNHPEYARVKAARANFRSVARGEG